MGEAILLSAVATFGRSSRLPTGWGRALLTPTRVIWIKGLWWWLQPVVFAQLESPVEISLDRVDGLSTGHSIWGSFLHIKTRGRRYWLRLSRRIFLSPRERFAQKWQHPALLLRDEAGLIVTETAAGLEVATTRGPWHSPYDTLGHY